MVNRSTFRYDYFVIWANGLRHEEEILAILRGEEKLELMEIRRVPIPDMREFILELYAHDSVPMKHLEEKIRYLFKEKPEALIVLARHFEPDEYSFENDWGKFTRSMYIHLLKERVRNGFNPRIEEKRTMENVIHASDHELQVDHILKMLGHPEGIEYLYSRYGKADYHDGLSLANYAPQYRPEYKRDSS